MADVIEINSEEIFDVSGAEENKQPPKKLKKRSIFRKASKQQTDEEDRVAVTNNENIDVGIIPEETSNENIGAESTTPAMKVGKKRFGFRPWKGHQLKTNAIVDETNESEKTTENDQHDETGLKDRVYLGPWTDAESKPVDEDLTEVEDSIQTLNVDEDASVIAKEIPDLVDTTEIDNEENEETSAPKLPAKKFRKLYWKRVSKSSIEMSTQTQVADKTASSTTCQAAEDETIVELSHEDGNVETPSKIPVKKIRKLPWKRMSKAKVETAGADAQTLSVADEEEGGDKELTEEKVEEEEKRIFKEKDTENQALTEGVVCGESDKRNHRRSLLAKWKKAKTFSQDPNGSIDEVQDSEEQPEENVKETKEIQSKADGTEEESPLSEDNENKKAVKKSRRQGKRSWKRFSWNVKTAETSNVAVTNDNENEMEDSVEEMTVLGDGITDEPLENDGNLTSTLPANPAELADLESPVSQRDNTLERSDLTYVTQLPETTADEVLMTTNPFEISDNNESSAEEKAEEAEEATNSLVTNTFAVQEEKNEKSLDFVLIDKFSDKPKDESFYLTKKALKVYKRAHLAQNYCQPCCSMM